MRNVRREEVRLGDGAWKEKRRERSWIGAIPGIEEIGHRGKRSVSGIAEGTE